MVGIALIGAAWAQEEPCGGVLAVEEWQDALDATERALIDLNVDLADRILDDLVDSLRCLGRPASPADLGRMARHIALVAFYDSDSAEVASWTWLTRDTVGGPWPEVLPVPDPFHRLRAGLGEPPSVRHDGGWLPPKKGTVLVDGRFSSVPEARSEVPHLVQVLDKRGAVAWGGWMIGADAPEDWLGDNGAPLTPPSWWSDPSPPASWAEEEAVAAAPESAVDPDPAAVDPSGDPAELESDVDPGDEGGDARRPRRTSAFQEIFPDCPWRAAPNKVSVEGTTVLINRKSYPARSAADVAALKAVYRSCGEFRAVRRLGRWAEARKGWFNGADVRAQRDAMVRVLVAEEPKRKK